MHGRVLGLGASPPARGLCSDVRGHVLGLGASAGCGASVFQTDDIKKNTFKVKKKKNNLKKIS